MIQCKCNLVGKLSAKENLTGKLNNAIVKEYPELEDLEVTPSSSEQSFKSSKYGYDNVKVKAIETTELNIMPSTENQVKEGTFSKVTVAGDSNLVAENIKKDVTIFNVTGTAEIKGEENAVVLTQPENGSYLASLIKTLPTLDFSKTTSLRLFFSGRTKLEKVTLINTSKVTDMQQVCNNCKELTHISFDDTSNVTNMNQAFAHCEKLQSVILTTNNVTNLTGTFAYCYQLKTIPLIDLGKCETIIDAFYWCSSLEDIGGFKDLGKAYTKTSSNYSNYTLDLQYSKLTHESLVNLINNLYDLNLTYNVSGGGTLYSQTLKLGANKNKLTAEEIAIATNKGWNVTL